MSAGKELEASRQANTPTQQEQPNTHPDLGMPAPQLQGSRAARPRALALPVGSVVLANARDLGAWYKARVLRADEVDGGAVLYTVQYETHRIDGPGCAGQYDTEAGIPESHVRAPAASCSAEEAASGVAAPPAATVAPAIHTVRLVSGDKEVFEVSLEVAMQSRTLKATIDAWMATGGMGAGNSIPCPAVESPILCKTIEFCTWHLKAEADGTPEDAKKEWSQKFVDVDQGTLFHMVMAANVLDIKPLLDLTCKAVADMIKGKTPEEIRAHFNINLTPEEEEEVRRENAWCNGI